MSKNSYGSRSNNSKKGNKSFNSSQEGNEDIHHVHQAVKAGFYNILDNMNYYEIDKKNFTGGSKKKNNRSGNDMH